MRDAGGGCGLTAVAGHVVLHVCVAIQASAREAAQKVEVDAHKRNLNMVGDTWTHQQPIAILHHSVS